MLAAMVSVSPTAVSGASPNNSPQISPILSQVSPVNQKQVPPLMPAASTSAGTSICPAALGLLEIANGSADAAECMSVLEIVSGSPSLGRWLQMIEVGPSPGGMKLPEPCLYDEANMIIEEDADCP